MGETADYIANMHRMGLCDELGETFVSDDFPEDEELEPCDGRGTWTPYRITAKDGITYVVNQCDECGAARTRLGPHNPNIWTVSDKLLRAWFEQCEAEQDGIPTVPREGAIA